MTRAQYYQELRALVSAKRKRTAAASLSVFIRAYLHKSTTASRPEFHNEILALLQRTATGGGGEAPHGGVKDAYTASPHFPHNFSKDLLISQKLNRLMIVAPRGFAKSTLCSVAFPLWLALYKRREDIFLVSATMSLAKEMLRKIRNEIESNEDIMEDFGDLRSDKWTEEVLVLNNGVTLRAKGRGFQIRGFRPDCIICDDLEDEEVLYSKEQRDKLENWFFRTLLPALKPEQDIIYVGTMLHQYSLMAKLEKRQGFFVKKYHAITDGKSIWESLWPTETLLKLKAEMGEYAFQAEYQNNPISMEEQPVKPHFLEGVFMKEKPIAACLAIDPAISEKESSDERAFVLMERTEDGFREVFSEKGRWGVDEQIDKIIGICVRYMPRYPQFRVLVESVAFQKVYKDILIKKSRQQGLFLPVSEAELGVGPNRRPKDKFTRLMQVVHLFEQRLVEIRDPDLREELLTFPTGESDNMVDACVFSLYWLMNFRSGGFKRKVELEKVVDAKPAYYVEEIRPGVSVVKTTGQPKMRTPWRMRLLKLR